MVVATRIDSFVPAIITQQNLYDGIKQAFSNAGYPAPFDEYTSGTDKFVVYAVVIDSTKLAGTAYLRIRVSNAFVLAQQLYTSWSVASHTGSNSSSEIAYSAFANNLQINLIALNANPEYKFVLAWQSNVFSPLGYLSPTHKPSWWDLNSFPYVFIPAYNDFSSIRTSNLTPYTQIDNDIALFGNTRLATANRITNRRDVLQGWLLLNQSNTGLAGRTSDDLILFSGSGTTRFDVLQIPGSNNQYLVLVPGNGGLAARVA